MNKKPTCAGSGLIALDVILNGSPMTPAKFFAGGSCGNVLAILAYLNWDTYPIARLANDLAAKKLTTDLKKWDVKSKLISKSDDGSTPIIIHRILRDKFNKPTHRFEFRDPNNGQYLPSYKAVLSASVDDIVKKQSRVNFYYFDRINRSSIELAKTYKKAGAKIFFEPSSFGQSEKLWAECLDVADIIKFSSDRISDYENKYKDQKVPLEIITLGKEGLKYRFSKNKRATVWKYIPAFNIPTLIDSAGAGDWCSAGVIQQLYKNNTTLNSKSIIEILSYAQALGAINCMYEGARGIMYNMQPKMLEKLAKALLENTSIDYDKIPRSNSRISTELIEISKLYS